MEKELKTPEIDGKQAKVTRFQTASRLQMVWKSHNFWQNEGKKVYLDP